MFRLVPIILLILVIFSNGIAQDSAKITTLTPYIEWLTKKTDEIKRINQSICIIELGISSKPSKILVNVAIETKTTENGESIAIVIVRTTTNEVVFVDVGSVAQAKLNYFLRIYSKDRRIDGVIEDVSSIIVDLTKLTTGETNDLPVVYQRIVALPKGKYAADFLIRDLESGNKATKKIKFEIR